MLYRIEDHVAWDGDSPIVYFLYLFIVFYRVSLVQNVKYNFTPFRIANLDVVFIYLWLNAVHLFG